MQAGSYQYVRLFVAEANRIQVTNLTISSVKQSCGSFPDTFKQIANQNRISHINCNTAETHWQSLSGSLNKQILGDNGTYRIAARDWRRWIKPT